MEASVIRLEEQLGVRLPEDYRQFLLTHRDQVLENSLVFLPPRSGVIDILLTIDDILTNSEEQCIGIPEKSLMHIGGNILGGYLYIKLSDEGFGEIHYMENYSFCEQFPSFSSFLSETGPE